MHRYPTRYQQNLQKEELVYVVNLTERSYLECTRFKAPRMAANLKNKSLGYNFSRWLDTDKIVFCPENCKGYVYRNFNRIY